MPRRISGVPDKTLADAFAERVAEEQQARAWSDAGLAKRASEHYPVSASTIWKIKNASPRRRVDLDEADALIRCFGFKDLADFLRDSDWREMSADWAKLIQAEADLRAAHEQYLFAFKSLTRRRTAKAWRRLQAGNTHNQLQASAGMASSLAREIRLEFDQTLRDVEVELPSFFEKHLEVEPS